MKLCIVTETYPPEVNGVAMTLHRLVSGLRGLGHQVHIVRPRQKGEARGAANAREETRVASLPLPGYHGLQFGLPCRSGLKRLWRQDRPDVVYVATEGPLGLSAIGAARRLRVPVASGFHTNFHSYMKHYKLPLLETMVEGFLRRTHNRTLRTFAPSGDVVEKLRGIGIRDISLLGRGVDTRLFNPSRRSRRLRESWGIDPENGLAAIFVSRIAAEKNIPLAIRAFKRVQERIPGAHCLFVGDGPERSRLEATHPELEFTGMRTGEDLACYYASADLFIFPSVTETFGNVVTEAMASGLVTIAFDYAAPKELIEPERSGFLAEYADEAAFMQALDRALKARDAWATIRHRALLTAGGLGWGRIVQRFAEELTLLAAPA